MSHDPYMGRDPSEVDAPERVEEQSQANGGDPPAAEQSSERPPDGDKPEGEGRMTLKNQISLQADLLTHLTRMIIEILTIQIMIKKKRRKRRKRKVRTRRRRKRRKRKRKNRVKRLSHPPPRRRERRLNGEIRPKRKLLHDFHMNSLMRDHPIKESLFPQRQSSIPMAHGELPQGFIHWPRRHHQLISKTSRTSVSIKSIPSSHCRNTWRTVKGADREEFYSTTPPRPQSRVLQLQD